MDLLKLRREQHDIDGVAELMVVPRELTCCVFLTVLDVVNQSLWVLHSQAQSEGLRAEGNAPGS